MTKVIKKTCLMCKNDFNVAEYYIRLHGDRKFCGNECFKRYRVLKGFLDAAKKNPRNKEIIEKRGMIDMRRLI